MIDNYIEDVAEGKKINLPLPILKNGEELTHVILKKPNAGTLRGLSLIKLIEMDFDAAMTILPRISVLNERDVLNLDTENMPALMTGIASFFVALA